MTTVGGASAEQVILLQEDEDEDDSFLRSLGRGDSAVKKLRDIEELLLKGDHITTRELRAAHAHYHGLRSALGELGRQWDFASTEANRLEQMCRQYLEARGEKI